MRFYNIDNIKYPSVTTVIGALPIPTALKLFKKNNPNAEFITTTRAYIGVMCHYYFECCNSTSLNRIAELEEVDEQFNTIENRDIITDIKTKIDFFLMEHKLEPISLEEQLHSHELQTAGRVDYIGYVDGKLSIVDLKTSKMFYKSDTGFDNHSIQLSAYQHCYKEMKGIEVPNLYILRVNENNWYELRKKKFDLDGFKYARKLFKEKYRK